MCILFEGYSWFGRVVIFSIFYMMTQISISIYVGFLVLVLVVYKMRLLHNLGSGSALVVFGIFLFAFLPYLLHGKEGFGTANDENTSQFKEAEESAGELSYQKTSLFDQEYIDPDDGKPKVKRFVNDTIRIWSQQTIDDFLNWQLRHNPDIVFDMDIVQQQATEEEAKGLLRDGRWPWKDRTKDVYADVLSRNHYIKRDPKKAMRSDQTIYNEQAMLHLLGMNEDEGQFLLFGKRTRNEGEISDYNGRGTYGISSGLVHPDVYSNSIRCNKGKLQMQKFKGFNQGISGQAMYENEDIDPKDLPQLYNGFQFINEPCNPCVGTEFPYNNTCPFSIKPNKKVSPAWEEIWGMYPSAISKLPDGWPFWLN